MKFLTLPKKAFFLCIFSVGILLSSCSTETQSNQSTQEKSIEVAELLQRGEKIQMGKEWDAVQNEYSDYKKTLSKTPNDNETKILLAKLYIKEARVTGEHGHYYPGALAVLEDAINDPEISDDIKFLALTTKAGVQLSLHEFSDALKTGNQALVMNPLNAQIYGVLVDANVELGKYDNAVMLMDKMVALKPDIRSYSRVSYLREIHGDVEGSIKAMTMAVKAGFPGTEETAWAMLTLGDIYQKYGQIENAEKVYKQILEIRPDYPFAVGALGDIAFAKGDETKAEKIYNQAMDIIPEVGFYISMAKLYKKQKRTEELEDITKEILVMLKEDTDSGHNMNLEYADLYYELIGDLEKAKEYSDIEYEKRPNNIDVNRFSAKFAIENGEMDLAKKYYSVASSTNSKYPELMVIREVLSANGKFTNG